MMFWNPETTPDGGALKFFASVRMDIRRINQIKENSGRVTGNRTPVKIVKNKVAAPFTECEFDINEAAKQYLKNNSDCEKDLEGQIKKIVHVSGGTDLAESVDNEQNTPI